MPSNCKPLSIPVRPAIRVALGILAKRTGQGGNICEADYAAEIFEDAIHEQFFRLTGMSVYQFLKLENGCADMQTLPMPRPKHRHLN